jgi:hypothetical protein
MDIQVSVKNRLKDFYFGVTNEHPFTTISKQNDSISPFLSRLAYGKRVWEGYPLIKSSSGKELLFIHIPKCAGTSIANFLNRELIHHFPAYAFYFSDPSRFQCADSFTITRNPVDRIASILCHYSNSIFATPTEKAKAEMLGLSEENLSQSVFRFLTDQSFRRELFYGARPGRNSFSVQQADYICWKRKIIVNHVFSFKRLDIFEQWLSEQMQTEIKLPHSNSSKRKKKFVPDDELEVLARKCLPRDYALWDSVVSEEHVMYNCYGRQI